jgi:hypothetical protein
VSGWRTISKEHKTSTSYGLRSWTMAIHQTFGAGKRRLASMLSVLYHCLRCSWHDHRPQETHTVQSWHGIFNQPQITMLWRKSWKQKLISAREDVALKSRLLKINKVSHHFFPIPCCHEYRSISHVSKRISTSKTFHYPAKPVYDNWWMRMWPIKIDGMIL